MAGRFGDDEEDYLKSDEPQVMSNDPVERKAARALRIKRRQDAIKKAEMPPEEAAAIDEIAGPIEQTTLDAAELLQRMSLSGAAKVTNVKVTTDEREVVRRHQFFHKVKESYEKIEAEANEAQLQYDAITDNWEKMLAIKDPLDIEAEMKEQKANCDALLQQKDELINHLKRELKKKDEDYYEDLNKQDNDIKEMSDRIEKQITIMQRAYEKQLNLIENAINLERDVMIERNNKRWEGLYKQRDKEEVAHMDHKAAQLEEQKEAMEAIMWDHHEKYRVAKIELETLIQELQKELEKLKAICIINTEKIGYTYQVLKKREEENVFVRSQQKRKLNKMSDAANNLRAKIRKAADDGASEEKKADIEIKKLMQTMDDLEKKSNQFSHTNYYKFSQVWRMSAARCMELAKELRSGEVALHAHILAEPPPPPPPPPPKSPLSKYEHEHAASHQSAVKVEVVKDPVDDEEAAAEAKTRLIRHILQLVADNTGFLVEDRLLKLIEKYELGSRNLCTLDAIFMALEIQAEDDINLLAKTFLNYSFCPICIGLEGASEMTAPPSEGSAPEVVSIGVDSTKGRQSLRGRPSMQARSISASTSRSVHIGFKSHELSPDDQLLMSEADEIIQKCGDPQATNVLVTGGTPDAGSLVGRRPGTRGVTVSAKPVVATIMKPSSPYVCPLGHVLEIEPMQVLTALSDFISVFVPPEKKKLNEILDSLKPPSFDTPSRRLTADEIDQYWTQWKNVFPDEKGKFWDGVLFGLNDYLTILQEREILHEEVAELRRRNAALRQLVRGALPEIPPARPRHARPIPKAFVAPTEDHDRLPPI